MDTKNSTTRDLRLSELHDNLVWADTACRGGEGLPSLIWRLSSVVNQRDEDVSYRNLPEQAKRLCQLQAVRLINGLSEDCIERAHADAMRRLRMAVGNEQSLAGSARAETIGEFCRAYVGNYMAALACPSVRPTVSPDDYVVLGHQVVVLQRAGDEDQHLALPKGIECPTCGTDGELDIDGNATVTCGNCETAWTITWGAPPVEDMTGWHICEGCKREFEYRAKGRTWQSDSHCDGCCRDSKEREEAQHGEHIDRLIDELKAGDRGE